MKTRIAVAVLAALCLACTATAATYRATLAWQDNSADESGFRIERQDVSTGGPFAPVGTVGANVVGFVDEPLTTNVDLCWQVLAFNAAGDSSPSNIACADVPVTPPGAPSNLTVTITEITTPPPGGLALPSNFTYGDGPWYDPVDTLPLDPQSSAIIAAWEASGGFGFGRLQMDWSIQGMTAPADTRAWSFTQNANFYAPDCDAVHIPIPAGGALEGLTGYGTCAADCHLIVWDPTRNVLFEQYTVSNLQVTPTGDVTSYVGGCAVAWDSAWTYGAFGRGYDCTSTEAAGLPIAPLLVTADEVASGEIRHAIRFILPSDRIRPTYYAWPATHHTSTSGSSVGPVRGSTFRLRADYPIDTAIPNAGARVIAKALQVYGMYLSDNGSIAMTILNDQFSTAKWVNIFGESDPGSGMAHSRRLDMLQPSDFEVVEMRMPLFQYTGSCSREPSAIPGPTAPPLGN
jgi:serine/threonine-protein kinase